MSPSLCLALEHPIKIPVAGSLESSPFHPVKVALPRWCQDFEDATGEASTASFADLSDRESECSSGTSSQVLSALAAGLPSKGSLLHESGGCKPCHYMYSKRGCENGAGCTYCHLRHQKRNRGRIPRTQRITLLRMLQQLEDAREKDEAVWVAAAKAVGAFLAENPDLQAYARAVQGSLRSGCVLAGIAVTL